MAARLRHVASIKTGGGIAGDLAISPNGRHLLATHCGLRMWNWKPPFGATLVHHAGAGAEATTGRAPACGLPAYVLDDGRAVAVEVASRRSTRRE